MQDELYVKDLRELLNEEPDKKGYMVVGLVTAEGVRWRDEAKNSEGEEIFAIAYMTVQFKRSLEKNIDYDVAVGESGDDSDDDGLIQQGQLELDVQISEMDFVDEYRSWEMSESEDGDG